jgi:hypothetical protein
MPTTSATEGQMRFAAPSHLRDRDTIISATVLTPFPDTSFGFVGKRRPIRHRGNLRGV